MSLAKAIVMGLIGLSSVLQLVYTGYYLAGGESTSKGAVSAGASLLSAIINGLCFAALYFDW